MRIVSRLVLIIAILIALPVAYVYGASEWKLRRHVDAPLVPMRGNLSPPDLVEGKRMAQIVGCWAGCHGMEGQGGSDDMEGYYSVTAPTLSSVLPLYTDDELVRLIRYGVKRDGRSAIGMSCYTFNPIGDADLQNIIAHLRAQPPRAPVPRHRTIGLGGRYRFLRGEWRTSADDVNRASPRWGELPRRTPFERGRYLASITCSECHGMDFRGNPFEGGPSLAIVAIYDRAQFTHLVHTGKPIGGRNLGIMSWTARNGFVHFTDQEVSDIYDFLRTYHGLQLDRVSR